MLATLFDWPLDDRHRLMFWSDVTVCHVDTPDAPVHSEAERWAELQKMATAMKALWNERAKSNAPRFDLISMLAHSEATRSIDFRELLATCSLLIVGGNDTTCNSMSGGSGASRNCRSSIRSCGRTPSWCRAWCRKSSAGTHTHRVLHLRRTARPRGRARRSGYTRRSLAEKERKRYRPSSVGSFMPGLCPSLAAQTLRRPTHEMVKIELSGGGE
jgi:hypothetical protein